MDKSITTLARTGHFKIASRPDKVLICFYIEAVLKLAFEQSRDLFGLFQFPRGGQYRNEHMAAARELKEAKKISRLFEMRF